MYIIMNDISYIAVVQWQISIPYTRVLVLALTVGELIKLSLCIIENSFKRNCWQEDPVNFWN